MSDTVQAPGPFERMVTVEVPEADLEAAKNRAARRISRDVKIKGFRPGRAPRRVVEAAVGVDRIRSEAIDDVLPDVVGAALEDADLEPAVTPAVEALREVEGGVEVDVRVTLWPTLGEVPSYAGREIEVERPDLPEGAIQEQLDRLRDQFAELETVARPAHEGDFVAINLTASRDGEPLEAASATDLLYEAGSNSLIEGLDGRVMGRSAGSIEQFDAVLPDRFGDLAGTQVSMQVLVKEVREKRLPELTDEWVSDSTEFETVDELRNELVERMERAGLDSARHAFQTRLVETLTDEMQLDVPEGLVNAQMEEIFHRFSHQLAESEIEIADYLQMTGLSQEAFLDDLRQQAFRSLRTDILLDAIADDAAVSVDDDELAALYEGIGAQRGEDGDALAERLAGSVQEKRIVGDILRRKALEVIVRGAVAVDENGSPIDLRFEELESGDGPAAEIGGPEADEAAEVTDVESPAEPHESGSADE